MENIKAKNPEDEPLRTTLPVVIFSYLFFLLLVFVVKSTGQTISNRTLALGLISVSLIFPFFSVFYVLKDRLKTALEMGDFKVKFSSWFWRPLILSVSLAIVFGAVGFLISVVVAAAFKQFVYSPFTYAIWPALFAGFWTYFSINYARDLDSNEIINIAGIFMVGGVGLSAILNQNPTWWTESVSYLGMFNDVSAKVLNISLLLSGALLLTLGTLISKTHFLRLYEKKLITKNTYSFLRFVFIVAPIGLACVGIFPYQPGFPRAFIHNFSAFCAFGLFSMLMFLTYWIMPFFSRYYMRINYTLFASILTIYGLFIFINYPSLALMEIMAFGIVAIWMVLFLRSLKGIVQELRS